MMHRAHTSSMEPGAARRGLLHASQAWTYVLKLIRAAALRVVAANSAPRTEREDDATRTKRAEAPGGRDRQRGARREDRDRRNRGHEAEATGEARERLGGCEGTSGQHNARAAVGDRAGCCQREVAVMPYTAITIADQILRIAKSKQIELTPLQLMKLTYIAHGWSFPLRGADLFQNRIEAWKYGPVIPDLYHATKRFGRSPISLAMVGDPSELVVDATTKAFLESVFNAYGHMSGVALSSLTHQSGTPWQQVYQEGIYNKEIPDALIRDHYNELHRVRQRSAQTA